MKLLRRAAIVLVAVLMLALTGIASAGDPPATQAECEAQRGLWDDVNEVCWQSGPGDPVPDTPAPAPAPPAAAPLTGTPAYTG